MNTGLDLFTLRLWRKYANGPPGVAAREGGRERWERDGEREARGGYTCCGEGDNVTSHLSQDRRGSRGKMADAREN